MTYSINKTLDYHSIKNLGTIDVNSDHVFDMSELTFAHPDGIVLLRLILHKLCNENDRDVLLYLPEKKTHKYNVRRYLAHINFFKDLNLSFQFADSIYIKSKFSLPKSKSNPSHTKLIDGYGFKLKSKMPELVFVLVNFLKEKKIIQSHHELIYQNIFDEAFLNQINHSDPFSDQHAYFCAHAQTYKNSRIKLCIGDNGVGILKSLNTSFEFKNHKEGLKAAVERRTSRFVENEERGGGIRFIFDKCRQLKLNCLLRSGDTEIVQKKGFQGFNYNKTPLITGTQLILWN